MTRLLPAWVLLLATAAPAAADDPAPVADPDLFDADGDGDIDADDRAILEHAEEVQIVDKSAGQRLRESARAVTVIDTEQARERTADMGEVLSRAQGLQVRRTGGLGSTARVSLNGLYDEQIRVFLDGVPLDIAGWGLGIANVPVDLVQRIDVHRGVVPIALGADALGGAIDLITDPAWVNRAAASYQVGSFGTHRATLSARARDSGTGAALGVGMFFDRARNDYEVEVEVADAQGRPRQVRVPRFHDGYRAAGASVEAGIVQRGAIERVIFRGYLSDSEKQIQHNTVMTVPYGEATSGTVTRGGSVEVALADGPWRVRLVAGGARQWLDFDDRAQVVYDWFGNVTRDRLMAGEAGVAAYQRTREDSGFARLVAAYAITPAHTVRFAVAPTLTVRTGTDFLHDPAAPTRDPLSADRDLRQLVSGVEYELRALGERLENIAFVKHYASSLDAEDVSYTEQFTRVERSSQMFGFGDLIRYALSGRTMLKASYEWATRLPAPDELFGDGVLTRPNLLLDAERGHNLNLGGRYDADTRAGGFALDVNGFARLTDHLILPLNSDRSYIYQNVYAARILGVEAGASWIAPGERGSLQAAVTVQDVRNASSDGTFGEFEGDRIPNRPWLLGSLAGTLRFQQLLRPRDELSLFANTRYVHEFFRGWESAGARNSQQTIESQLVHSAGATYAIRSLAPIVTTLEMQNLLDAKVFDSFGVQRPGRAVYLKVAVEM